MKHAYSKTELMKMLADAGIRPSVQRLAILEYVSADKCHPTADEIYANLVKDNPMLSRTTVFSNVRLLAENGLVNDIDILSDSTRYDTPTDPPHAHFMCRRCHRIFDIPLSSPLPVTPEGFNCDNVNVFFKGLCPDCSENADNETELS